MKRAGSRNLPFFTKFEGPLKISLCLQLLILLLASTLLDGGILLQWMLLAAVAYWCALAIIMIRRNGGANLGDRFLIAWGYPVMIVVTAFALAIVPVGLLRR